MTTPDIPPLDAEWALLSKPPADSGDYRVLACSEGPRRAAEFEDLVRDTLFGTPPHWTAERRQSAENLPWISFGVSGDGRRAPHRVSVSVTDRQPGSRDTRDSAGRYAFATRYFTVRYEDLARRRAGLTQLWNAVRAAELPPQPYARRVPLYVEPDPLPRLAELLDEEDGFGWAAATAATALTAPIALVAGSSAYAMTRIETMDQVIALLPYGYRTSVTAATWAPDPWSANPWLCYTHRPAPPSTRITVREHIAPEPADPRGRAHLARLRDLRAESGTLGCLRVLASFTAPAALPPVADRTERSVRRSARTEEG